MTNTMKSKDNKILFPWITLVLIITLTITAIGFNLPIEQNVTNYNQIITYKELLSTLAISFAITAVLIV